MVLLRIENNSSTSFGRKLFKGAAFIRIKDGKTHWITRPFILKPIQLWKKMAKDLKLKVTDLLQQRKNSLIKPENYVTAEIGLLTLKILLRIKKKGLEKQ
jgi:uncharacterized protein